MSSPVSIKLSWVELWDEILFVWSTIYEISCIGLDDTVFWLDCFLYFSNDALYPVYTIQPVVKLVVKPVWQPVDCSYTRYSRLPVVKRDWQPVWQPRWTNSHSFNRLSLNRVVQPVWCNIQQIRRESSPRKPSSFSHSASYLTLYCDHFPIWSPRHYTTCKNKHKHSVKSPKMATSISPWLPDAFHQLLPNVTDFTAKQPLKYDISKCVAN